MNDKKIPFPQADDFEKIIEILNVEDEEKLNNKMYLSKLLGNIHERQVAYYMSAAMYIGVVDTDKKFTEYAKSLRKMSGPVQIAELALRVVSNPIFGRVFFLEKILDTELDLDDIIEIMKENNIYFESEAMYKRRAQTVLGWIKWINKIISWE